MNGRVHSFWLPFFVVIFGFSRLCRNLAPPTCSAVKNLFKHSPLIVPLRSKSNGAAKLLPSARIESFALAIMEQEMRYVYPSITLIFRLSGFLAFSNSKMP